MMLLSKSQIQNGIDWLLNNATAPVKYLTNRNLCGQALSTDQIKKLWNEVMQDPQVIEIFSKQKPDGSWCSSGSWAPSSSYVPKGGYSAFTPKYITTVWLLSILGDMGFDFHDNRVKKACEYTLSFQRSNGQFSRFINDQAIELKREENQDCDQSNCPCNLAVYLHGLGKVGMGNDVHLKKSYELLVKWQRNDGGWVYDKHKGERNWSRSCPAVSYNATAALYYSRLSEHKNALRKALKFMVWHLSIKNRRELRQFHYHGHNMVQELLMLSELKVGLNEDPVQEIIRWLMSLYNADEGCFRYREKSASGDTKERIKSKTRELKYRLYHLVEDDWLTYYMMRIGKNFIET